MIVRIVKMNNNLHLTLSVIIKNQKSNKIIDSVLGVQGFLISGLESAISFYICGKDVIHHSLVDFLPAEEFQNVLEIKNYKQEHQDLITTIIRAVEKLKNEMEDRQTIIKSVYKSEKSIALEAYPSQDILNFAERLGDSIKMKGGFPKVKGFPPEKPKKFAINIIRFFRLLTKKEDEILRKRIEELNKKLNKQPIVFKLKSLSLVVSDDYLSNPNPEIARFDI